MMQPHIRLDENLGVKYAILPGDPGRIDKIIPFLENVQEIGFNREYRSVTGTYKGVKVLCMSTGMGGVSTAIGVEELANIGLEALIRIGSCGSLQPEIGLGDLIIPSGVVRDDGTSHAYIRDTYPAVPDHQLLCCLFRSAKELNIKYFTGITRSHESFYAKLEEDQVPYWISQGVLGEDMESAPLMVVGRLRGLKTASILNNVSPNKEDIAKTIGNYVDGDSSAAMGEKNEILVALEAFVKMEEM
ncbi:MAG: nucleoside phosphorylase [Clostridia bacterium]|nr:nucleoside phosphorylase [Clostridia bacterium]